MTFLEFIEHRRSMPFAWGKNDCMTFVLDGIEVQTGVSFDRPKYRTEAGARRALVRILRDSGASDVTALFDRHFERSRFPSPIGTLIARPAPEDRTTGYAMGFAVSGAKGAFLAARGLEFARHEPGDVYWRIE